MIVLSPQNNLTAEIAELWGPDSPTPKAIYHRIKVMKTLRRAPDSKKAPQTVKAEGFLTPQSSPVKRPQKFEDEDPEEFTPRKLPKRTTRGTPKYKVEEKDGEDGALFVRNEDDDDQADERKPHSPAAERVQKTEIDVENPQADFDVGNHHFEPNPYLQYF
jgi:hypothetical protein